MVAAGAEAETVAMATYVCLRVDAAVVDSGWELVCGGGWSFTAEFDNTGTEIVVIPGCESIVAEVAGCTVSCEVDEDEDELT